MIRGNETKNLYPSFANPETWRGVIKEEITREDWKILRLKILKRDDYTCGYCGFRADKWQIVHHIDGNPNNNDENNLETICQMCNLIHHAGQGCAVQKIVDLYEKSKYSQIEIIRITRNMRVNGKSDKDIIKFLGLIKKVQFRMDKDYLKKLFGFVTSRIPNEEMTQKGLEYMYQQTRNQDKIVKLSSFVGN